ncbi:hypothetical protein PHLCEN_2v865 [Hermanssonia centrifuga]|uniref:Uncharacterized protein n=1 Tax=Hermanssonia centrifuga TaxID=98765 RepID=A0A2R6S4V2_9APHY|nr:hypothetical protein PHLCEN_2v865 [Hermanssonia centrifuga]
MSTAVWFTLEGVTEALASELDPEWNIKVDAFEIWRDDAYGVLRQADYPRGVWRFRVERQRQRGTGPPHAAYLKPSLASTNSRPYFLDKSSTMSGDAGKAIARVYDLAQLEDPPLGLPLGNDGMSQRRRQI